MDYCKVGVKQDSIRNITELFPSDWHPRPTMTTDDEKEFQVLKEVMTNMFQQCGYLKEENIIELSNYQDFLRALQHHIFMGDVSVTQLIHFIILMVYMSFCRLHLYTEYMTDREAVLLKAAIHISLVIMAFKTTFSIQGGHHSINPYITNLPPVVRRYLHIVNTKYLEQQCTCKFMYNVTLVLYPSQQKWYYQPTNTTFTGLTSMGEFPMSPYS